MTPLKFEAFDANCSNTVKDVDFKCDKHVFRDSTDMTHQKFSEKRSRPGTRGGATPGPGRSYALPLKNWDLALGPACEILIKFTGKAYEVIL